MANTGLLIGWSRPVVGREKTGLQRFGEYVGYLGMLQAEKQIESFEPVLLEAHGGTLNGFFLIRAEKKQLEALRDTDAWRDWETWGQYALEGFCMLRIATGDRLADAVKRWGKVIGA